jgi:transcriptional regulator with XRE-family HTH domain
MGEGRLDHVSETFARLLVLYRRPDGSEWGGQDLESATGGVVSRSYATNLRKGRIDSPGLDKLKAIAEAMGFPPQLWFDDGARDQVLEAALEDETVRAILEEALRLGPRDRQLLLAIARQIISAARR